MIEGVPLYGDRNVMERFWSRAGLEEIPLAGSAKVLASASAGIVFSDVVGRLARGARGGRNIARAADGGGRIEKKIVQFSVRHPTDDNPPIPS